MKIPSAHRHTILAFISTMGITLVGFISTIYFAHVAGPSVLGLYFVFFAFYCILDQLGDGGTGLAIVKRVSEGQDQNQFFSAFVALRVVFFLLTLTVVGLYGLLFNTTDFSAIVPFLVIALVAGLLYSITSNGVYGQGMVGKQQLSSLLNNILKVVFQIGFVIAGFGFAGLAGGCILGILAAAVCNWHFLTLGFSRFSLGHIKSLYRYAFWLFLAGIATVLFSNVDTLILTIFLSPRDIGIYRTVFQLTAMATLASTALCIVLFPKISSWHARGEKDLIGSALTTAFTYSLMLAVPVCVGGMVLCDRLLYYLYGPSFVEGTGVLIILLFAQIFSVFMYLQIMCLNAINKPGESCKAMGIAIIINIFLNIVLIPLFGLVGAAIAAVFAVIVNALIAYKALSTHVRLDLDAKALRNILVASGVMGGALLILRLFVPFFHLMVLVAAVVFGTLLFFFTLLKLDSSLRSELIDIAHQFGFRIP